MSAGWSAPTVLLNSQVCYLHPPFVHKKSLSPVTSLNVSTVLNPYYIVKIIFVHFSAGGLIL